MSLELPEVIVGNRQLLHMTRAALHALHEGNNPEAIFYRSGELVRVARDEKQTRPKVQALSKHSLRGALSRTAKFVRHTRDGKRNTIPPEEVVQDILSLAPDELRSLSGGRIFPPLTAVTEVPYLRPDGTVITSPGYDKATGILYHPAPNLDSSAIPEQPSSEDVRVALSCIDEVIGEFPFDSEASKANMIALLLTGVVRPAILGCVPLAVLDAPCPGNGKSLLAECAAVLATGTAASMQTAPSSDEEWRKKITAGLRDGASLMLFDNLSRPLDSASLAAVLTCERWRDRELGLSRDIEVEQRAVWVVTGNNVRFGQTEFKRRCYRIRLDAKVADPAQGRYFKHSDLKRYVQDERAVIVAALLTLARAWFAAGKPATTTPTMGSFENWTRTLGGILQFAGIRGFLDNNEEMAADANVESNEWEEFLGALKTHFGDRCFKSGDVAHAISVQDNQALVDALPSSLSEHLHNDAKLRLYLGKAFADHNQQRFGQKGLHLIRTGKSGNSARWKVATT